MRESRVVIPRSDSDEGSGRILAQGTVQEIFEQEEMLRRIRLDVPVIPKLCRALRRRGAALPVAYTDEEAEEGIAGALALPRRP